MKLKKIVLLLSMLICVSLATACSDGQEKIDFDYTDLDVLNSSVALTFSIENIDEATKVKINNTEGQEVYQTAISNFETANEECGELSGFRLKDGSVATLQDVAAASQDADAFNQCLLNIDSEITEEGNTVKVILTSVYEKRDAKISFIYKSAPKQASVDENTGELVIPFDVSEITVAPVYTTGEKMSQAGMNTLMGMGSVFLILLIIEFIISQFERLSKFITKIAEAVGGTVVIWQEKRVAKKAAKKAAKEAAKEADVMGAEAAMESAEKEQAVQPMTVDLNASDNLINDSELVAVVTAAIMAAEGQTVSAGSDGLIVRSIKKAKR